MHKWPPNLVDMCGHWVSTHNAGKSQHGIINDFLEFLYQESIIDTRFVDCGDCIGTGGNNGECDNCNGIGYLEETK